MFNYEQLMAISQFLKSSTGKALLEKLLEAVGNYIKKIPLSKESNSPNFEAAKKPSFSSLYTTGLGKKTTSLKTFLLVLLLGMMIVIVRDRI